MDLFQEKLDGEVFHWQITDVGNIRVVFVIWISILID